MKKHTLSAFLFAALCAAGAAQAQNAPPATQEYQYPSLPSKDGSQSPPSTLREVSDRAAVSNAQMQAGVAQCLKELEQRRQQ